MDEETAEAEVGDLVVEVGTLRLFYLPGLEVANNLWKGHVNCNSPSHKRPPAELPGTYIFVDVLVVYQLEQ